MNARNAQILRRLACTGIAAALALPAAAVAGGRDNATLQNDIAHYGVSSGPGGGSGATLRNDEAHFGPKASASAAVPQEAPAAIVVRVDGGLTGSPRPWERPVGSGSRSSRPRPPSAAGTASTPPKRELRARKARPTAPSSRSLGEWRAREPARRRRPVQAHPPAWGYLLNWVCSC